jgi:hypothetical protein
MEQLPSQEKLNESSVEYYFDQKREIDLFYKNLFENDQKFHWDKIYEFFPEINNIHTNPDNLTEEELYAKISEVILNFREKYADNIKLAEKNVIDDLPEVIKSVKALETLMGENEHYEYLAMPSIYPICPFDVKKNLFYFSITNVSKGQTDFKYIFGVAPHEISHFIFFRQINDIENTLSDRGIHHLKEVLTPVILEHPDIKKYRIEKYKNSEYPVGNKESMAYQIEVNGKIMSIFDYVKNEYLKNPIPEGYMSFLHWIIRLFEQIEPEVLICDELFNKNGRAILDDPELKEKFMKPIKLNDNK